MRRSERLIATAEMLRRQGSRGCSAERLASEFGVSVRTVKRDLAALASSGAPVWSRPGPGGGYGLAGSGSLPPVSLTPAQAVALLAAVSAAAQAPYADLARAGVHKIVDVLDPSTRARALDLAGRVWVNVPATDRTVMSAVEEAMTDQRVVRLQYKARDGTRTTRDVEPVIFACARGAWYLVGWCRLRDGMRWFALERIRNAAVTAIACAGHTVEEVGEPPEGSRPVHGARPSLPSLGVSGR